MNGEQMNSGALGGLRSANYGVSSESRNMSPMHMESTQITHTETVEVSNGASQEGMNSKGGKMGGAIGALIVWFFIIFIASWLILYALKPSIVLTEGNPDTGKILLGSFLIALIVIILIFLIKGCMKSRM